MTSIFERTYTPEETALLARVKVTTVYQWVHRRRIRFLHVGAAVRIPESAIAEKLVPGPAVVPPKANGRPRKHPRPDVG